MLLGCPSICLSSSVNCCLGGISLDFNDQKSKVERKHHLVQLTAERTLNQKSTEWRDTILSFIIKSDIDALITFLILVWRE